MKVGDIIERDGRQYEVIDERLIHTYGKDEKGEFTRPFSYTAVTIRRYTPPAEGGA